MTLKDQLHKSGSHATGFDPACLGCCADLGAVITHLERCADQNERDAKASGKFEPPLMNEARAVASEQRRMIRILKQYEKSKTYGPAFRQTEVTR